MSEWQGVTRQGRAARDRPGLFWVGLARRGKAGAVGSGGASKGREGQARLGRVWRDAA